MRETNRTYGFPISLSNRVVEALRSEGYIVTPSPLTEGRSIINDPTGPQAGIIEHKLGRVEAVSPEEEGVGGRICKFLSELELQE